MERTQGKEIGECIVSVLGVFFFPAGIFLQPLLPNTLLSPFSGEIVLFSIYFKVNFIYSGKEISVLLLLLVSNCLLLL